MDEDFKGIGNKVWNEKKTNSVMKKMIGNHLHANLNHPKIVKMISPFLFHRSKLNEHYDHWQYDKHKSIVKDQRFELIMRMSYVPPPKENHASFKEFLM